MGEVSPNSPSELSENAGHPMRDAVISLVMLR